MTDRELLELAAKAAGIDLYGMAYMEGNYFYGNNRDWSPLINDGDALRLAVKLGIGIAKPDRKFSNVRRAFVSDIGGFSVTDEDPYAATRRAIIRAAAEIGKNLCSNSINTSTKE